MKHALSLLLLAAASARAAVVVTTLNAPIPLTFEGLHLNPYTGATSTASSVPDWNTSPWINPFFGGVYIASGDLLLPIITGTDQIVNLAAGTVIDGSLAHTLAESGSTTHFGAGAGQFQAGVAGYIGFRMQPVAGGPVHYGWIKATLNNTGAGVIESYAYESTPGEPIAAGATVSGAPEPSRAVLFLAGATWGLLRRRRMRAGR